MPMQRNRFHGRWQYLFIESICNDAEVLAQNYRYKMMYSPDYKTSDSESVSMTRAPAEREAKVAQPHPPGSTPAPCRLVTVHALHGPPAP